MKIIISLGLFIGFTLIYNYIQISRFYINKPTFHSQKLSKGLRITQISDYHSNRFIDTDKLLNEIKKFNPHFIVLTGDIIDERTEDIGLALELMEGLLQINKNIFYVMGNHELDSIDRDRFIFKLNEMGVTVLNNENRVLDIQGEKVNICGVTFFTSKRDYEKALDGIDFNNYTILLSHSPNRPINYHSGQEDLIISGHTHGGQIRLPFIGAIIVPGQGLFLNMIRNF